MARLRAAPLIITIPDGSTFLFIYQDLIGSALGVMYDSFSWPSFVEFLVAIESLASPTTLGYKLHTTWTDVGLISKRGFPNYPNYVEGWPHCAFFLSAQADVAVGEYLVNLTLSPDGYLYQQDWTPFYISLSSACAVGGRDERAGFTHVTVPQAVSKRVK